MCLRTARRSFLAKCEEARPEGLEPSTPGLEEQWRYSGAALFSGGCGGTHASYPRVRGELHHVSRDSATPILVVTKTMLLRELRLLG